jgi:hypothetical protein
MKRRNRAPMPGGRSFEIPSNEYRMELEGDRPHGARQSDHVQRWRYVERAKPERLEAPARAFWRRVGIRYGQIYCYRYGSRELVAELVRNEGDAAPVFRLITEEDHQ